MAESGNIFYLSGDNGTFKINGIRYVSSNYTYQANARLISIYPVSGTGIYLVNNEPFQAFRNFEGNSYESMDDLLFDLNSYKRVEKINQEDVNQDNYQEKLSSITETKEYFIDGVVDLSGFELSVTNGINIKGYDYNTSVIKCTEENYTLLTGGGNILIENVSVEISGSGSKVFALTGTGNEAIEMNKVNFISCTSLGEITDYRQGLESGTGRISGTPELSLSGSWDGYRVTTSIVLGLSNITALFKTGIDLEFSGRFITDINADLPAVGALLDFAPENILNDESLLIQGAYVRREGVINANDSGITPNISEKDNQCNWKANTGVRNTKKYIKTSVTVEATTTIAAQDTYYPLLGTWLVSESSHFQSPSNGVYELLSGNGNYQVVGDLIIAGFANDQVDIRVTKSVDDGLTFPEEINHIRRTINNLSGIRDVAFFPINFIVELKDGEMIRIEIENKSGTNDLTAEIDSYIIVTEI